MKVITNNPLYIDSRQINRPSEYLSFDGANISQVQAFQDWMDISRPGWYRGGKGSTEKSQKERRSSRSKCDAFI